ncbi:MAG: glycosyltransferase [Bacteroidetes bacterium]|nr:glycosyltransferase [Bacteroidota bacterium]
MLTPRIPYPLRDGGSIAMNQSLQAYLEQDCEVSLLSMNTSRHWIDESTLPNWYQRLVHFRTVYVRTDVNPLSAFINLFTDKSYNVSRFMNKDFEKELVKLLQQESFDIIQFESIYTSPYLKLAQKYSDAKCICRVHNIEHLIWQRLSEHESNFLKRKYLELLTNRLKNFELDVLQKFDLLLPISPQEEMVLTSWKINTCYFLPFGVDHKSILPAIDCDLNSCFHIGSMDWAPNVEGVHWFLNEVWKQVHQTMPNITLYLAGKNMPASIHSNKNEGIEVIGEVDDVTTFSLSKNIMLVPLLSGAGIRIKIIEAMALGKTIIATTIAAEGIGAQHQQHIVIADTAEDFSFQLQSCLNNPVESNKIGQRAREFVELHFQKDVIYHDLVNHLKSIM